jgi:hypothetical protein
VTSSVPALAPAKALRSDVSVPMRRRLLRAPQAAGSAATTDEPPRGTAAATGSQLEAAAAAAATAAATAATIVPPAPTPTVGGRAAMVDIPDDDVVPPGWGQWEDWPAPAPEPAAGVLVMREDCCVMPRRPTHGVEVSSSRAPLPAPDAIVARPEQERGHAGAPPTHFDEA